MVLLTCARASAVLVALLASSTTLAGDPNNLLGEWRGQAQYQATIDRTSDPAAHAVTNLTIRVEPGGKVWGTSTENGCKVLGIGRPLSATTNLLNLDVTLSGCQYPGLNRRYSGTLAYYSPSNVALDLRAHQVSVTGGKQAAYDVRATMRR